MSKLNDFINIINSKIGCPYIWGGQNDEVFTKEKLQWFVNTFGREHYYFSTYSVEKWIGKQGYYDCSGLIVYTLLKMGLITQDYSAGDLYYSLCTPIKKEDLKAGDLVFVKDGSSINHAGTYMSNNRVTHARGSYYGVVNTALFDSFNLYGRLKFFKDELEEKPITTIEDACIFLQNKAFTDLNGWIRKAKEDPKLYDLFMAMAKGWDTIKKTQYFDLILQNVLKNMKEG
jgi:cell wall-associated NlpC family hydrolase